MSTNTEGNNELQGRNSIIERILADQTQTKEEVKAQGDSNKILITHETYLTEDSEDGIENEGCFMDRMATISENSLKALEKVIQLMNDGKRINTTAFPSIDKAGNAYQWLTCHSLNGSIEFKLPTDAGIEKLLTGYINGTYKVNLSLEKLYNKVTTAV